MMNSGITPYQPWTLFGSTTLTLTDHHHSLTTEGIELGLLKRIKNWNRKDNAHSTPDKNELLRRCHFEIMEPRKVLSADPVIAGVTYLEGDAGQDTTPDYFEITFQGGAETTQLTQFVINGDQDLSGSLTDGDMFFHTSADQIGAGEAHGFQFNQAGSSGISRADILGVTMSDDGLNMIVDVQNFEEGDVLAFTIDVDEVESLRPDKIASGVEFEGSFFNATFVDENYSFDNLAISTQATIDGGFVQNQNEGIFYDHYDSLIAEAANQNGGVLELVLDNEEGQSDRNAGAVDAYELTPKPIMISGTVYHDENLNCEHDADEDGIENVTIELQLLNSSGNYETVATTQTDADGNYMFGKDLGLMPGDYRLVEQQPEGFIDVGSEAGTVEGLAVGTDSKSEPNVIGDISIPLGGTSATDYDFKEVKPASLAGNVWHDENNDGVFDSNEQGIADVLIQVTRVGAKEGVTSDPFAGFDTIFVRTDANGHYSVDSLPPGIYEVVEINNYPGEDDPLAPFIDGKDSIGNIDGTTVGSKANDKYTLIELCAGDDGVEYNFGEIKPASLGGYVSVHTPEGECLDPTDPNYVGIEGVDVELYDQQGNLVGSTQTDANGQYEFDNLEPGVYTIVEVQPSQYLDGEQSIGNIDGVDKGRSPENDKFVVSLTSGDEGVMYNFCEHIPAELCGTVWHDSNNDGVIDSNEDRIAGTVIQLFDADGSLIAETTTDADGAYCFKDLLPGKYTVREIQPAGFNDGKDSLGVVTDLNNGLSTVGEKLNDEFCVKLNGGDKGTEYNFGELLSAEICGTVYHDVNNNGVQDAGEEGIEGTLIQLFDADGNLLSETRTDADGNYCFNDLLPGEYCLKEIQPNGYNDGKDQLGQVGALTMGTKSNDEFCVTLESGDQGVNYDFGELLGAEICGTVYHDANDNGVQDAGEEGIAGTLIQLFDADGNVLSETRTDADGNYCFVDLLPGEYCVKEIQPEGYKDGKDAIGQVGDGDVGDVKNDELCKITLQSGDRGVNYDFGELKLAEISGYVHTDPDGNCELNPEAGDEVLANVVLELINADGNVVATTTTDVNGFYEFKDVMPGDYSIRQEQPDGFFTAGQNGQGNGDDSEDNIIGEISIGSGQKLTHYNFCEAGPAEIHGRVWEDGPAFETEDGNVPDNYRDLRDGVYQEGVDTPIAGVRMYLYFLNDIQNGVTTPVPVTLKDVLAAEYTHMGTSDPDAPVWVDTMANGEYWFMGLQAGNYVVLETQPTNYVDANDFPGTRNGGTFNSELEAQTAPQTLTSTFSGEQLMDSIVGITLQSNDISIQNNFTEVRAVALPVDPLNPFLPTPPDPTPFGNPQTPRPGLTGTPGLAGSMPSGFTQFVGTASGLNAGGTEGGGGGGTSSPYTWHLSVVNAGAPRAVAENMIGENNVWQQASFIADADWTRFNMDDAVWAFTTMNDSSDISLTNREARFGMIGGTPLAGDFDGDGIDEVAVFKAGYWMIDLNHNGRWDQEDLLAKLGDEDDRPVVGDWDGDGKDDIGIYGPMWARDPEAIAQDPGLPNPENSPFTKPKNVPPSEGDATNGARFMKLTAYGRQRADVVDHVFGTGEEEDVPVTGDWNGNGIRAIGTFNAGNWQMDINGDGKFDHLDRSTRFGRAGDLPLVGDFNGDGIEEIAVFRSGTWIIDTNGNLEMDAADKTFELGGAGDLPVVGDWNGDGIDEPAIYRQGNASIME